MSTPLARMTIRGESIPADWFHDPHHARGYFYDGKPWAVVELGALELIACDTDGLDGFRRLAAAITRAVARAEQATQDAALAEHTASAQTRILAAASA